MKIRDKFSGEEYEVFEKPDWPTDRVGANGEHGGVLVTLDSPSGDTVEVELNDDAVLLLDSNGNITAAPPALVNSDQFEGVI